MNMKITETRKAIIELIEPYMNKIFSDGCLIQSYLGLNKSSILELRGYKDNRPLIFNHYCNYFQDEPNINQIEKIKTEIFKGPEHYMWERTNQYKYKIIGHYDITAVLKYLQSKKRRLTHCTDKFFYFNTNGDNSVTFEIPNKPLHLYTEEEDKDLLDLLLKLK